MLKSSLIALALILPGAMAHADKIEIGRLACAVDGSIGFVIGSTREIVCTFSRNGVVDETYRGQIDRLGLDLGVTAAAHSEWLVFAATESRTNSGIMTGTYVGKSADASLGLGGGVSVLVGGFNKSVSLQPVSAQVQAGINVAWTLTKMKLQLEKN